MLGFWSSAQESSLIVGKQRIGMQVIFSLGCQPRNNATEATRFHRKDVAFFEQPIAAGWIRFQFPRCWVIMTVGADAVGYVVVIQLTDAAREVADAAKRLRQAGAVRDRLTENLRIGKKCQSSQDKVQSTSNCGWAHSGNWQ